MSATIPDKTYFRIGEVGKILGVEPYVVRYWESEFKTVQPIRTKSYQRLYRKKDIQELLKIKTLLYRDRFTIAGAKRKLTDKDEEPAEAHERYLRMLVDIREELQHIRNSME